MSPLNLVQYFLFSLCVNLFAIFSYLVYYTDVIKTATFSAFQDEYDFVIVGSGTAGSLLAHRLATETSYSFIVLEAGGHSSFLHDIPVLGPLLHNSVYDWQYETVPQKYACYAMKENKCRLPQGKIIGGSSKLNNMVHVRGNISHYTSWFHGKYTEQYIKKNFEYVEKYILKLNELQYESVLANAILEAAKELGYESLSNEDFKLGFKKSTLSQYAGKRWSTSDNIVNFKHILSNAFVTKISIKNDSAKSVEFKHLGKKQIVKVRNGLILSAGTYNTPKILQLSGIGPSELLKKLKIKILKDLPVGKNLQDHVASGLDLVLFNQSLSLAPMDMLNPYNALQYFFNGKGPFTSPGCEVVGFVSTQNKSIPDLQFMVLPVGISSDKGSNLRYNLGIKDEIWDSYFTNAFDKISATILPIILHPSSKGEVYIKAKDANIAPSINPNYLATAKDQEVLISGLKILAKLINSNSLISLGAHLNNIPITGCEEFIILSDAYWNCYIKHLTLSSYHPIGTCSMGIPESKDSVVDTSFKVIGINNLFVVDASVLPTLPSGNINAAIAMVANIFFEEHFKNRKQKICDKYEMVEEVLFRKCRLPLIR